MRKKSYPLFGSGGGQKLADENGIKLLVKVPMEMPLQEDCNEGEPIVQSRPNSLSAQAFRLLANKVLENTYKIT